MSVAHLYCQGRCAACSALRHSLVAHGVDVETYDVSTDPRAYDTVIALGYRSLPVLVSPDGTAAAGARAGELAHRLTSRAEAPAGTNLDRVHGPTPPATRQTSGGDHRHTHHLVSEPYRPGIASRKDQS